MVVLYLFSMLLLVRAESSLRETADKTPVAEAKKKYGEILLIRHGDKADKGIGSKKSNTKWARELSPAGHHESYQLADFLNKYVDAKKKAQQEADPDNPLTVNLIVSAFRRTIMTAACFSLRSGIKMTLRKSFGESGNQAKIWDNNLWNVDNTGNVKNCVNIDDLSKESPGCDKSLITMVNEENCSKNVEDPDHKKRITNTLTTTGKAKMKPLDLFTIVTDDPDAAYFSKEPPASWTKNDAKKDDKDREDHALEALKKSASEYDITIVIAHGSFMRNLVSKGWTKEGTVITRKKP